MATLFSGQSLTPGQTLQSDYGVYTLTMQSDGNVVLRNNASTPLWRTGTGGNQFVPRDFIMQTDGNLVLYDTSGQPHWASKTPGNPGAFLNVQDDGNLVVYRAGSTTQTADNALWASGTNVPPPLTLAAVVDNGAMLDVGDVDLDYLSYDMLFNPKVTSSGADMVPYTGHGSSSPFPPPPGGGCAGATTVNVTMTGNWDPDGGPGWNWQQMRDAFAGALRAAMTAASNTKKYQNYSYTEIPVVGPFGSGVACEDPQPSDSGYYIPPGFQITAYHNGLQAGQVTIRYSTGDQSGGSVCDEITGIVSDGLPLVLDDPAAAVVAAIMDVTCDLIDG